MSKRFAEKILDGMVDENGHCGERGMSQKQFDCIAQYLEEGDVMEAGGWQGDYKTIWFTTTDYEGNIGKYHVVLNDYYHFNHRYTVVSIEPRPKEEVELERKLAEMAKFEHSEWVGEPKQRMELELTLIRDFCYDRERFDGRGWETAHIYTFADADGNCIVWKTGNAIYVEDEDYNETYAELGDTVCMKATVKEHSEYKGVKQTVVNRPKINGIGKAA